MHDFVSSHACIYRTALHKYACLLYKTVYINTSNNISELLYAKRGPLPGAASQSLKALIRCGETHEGKSLLLVSEKGCVSPSLVSFNAKTIKKKVGLIPY